jgi:sporulation protein YlmC with PRC-barrel domain
MAKQKSAGEEDPLILGYEVYNSEGEKIGQVEETYHGTTGLVEWMGVRGDGSAGRLVLLPLKTAQIQDGKVYIPYSKEEVMTAPELDDDGHVPEEAERWLYAHQESQAPEQESVTDMWERRKASRQAPQDEGRD